VGGDSLAFGEGAENTGAVYHREAGGSKGAGGRIDDGNPWQATGPSYPSMTLESGAPEPEARTSSTRPETTSFRWAADQKFLKGVTSMTAAA
jgi:hypothetical protein